MTTNTPHTASLNPDDRAAGDASTQDLHARSDAQVVALLRQWVEDYQARPEDHSHFPSIARIFFEAAKALADEEKRRTATHRAGAAKGTHSAQDDMAARRHALEQAYVVLDRESELALDYGDCLHLVTVLQRAIAAHDICLFGDSSQEQPIDVCAGYNQMRNDAEALAHLAQAFYDSEWRSSRRLEAGINIDD